MRRIFRGLFVFLVILPMFFLLPCLGQAQEDKFIRGFFGKPAVKPESDDSLGQKIWNSPLWLGKQTGKALFLTGKGVYKTTEYILVEVTRPLRAVTEPLINKFGVKAEEETRTRAEFPTPME